MGKEYIVQGAMCMCKFGAAPGILKVTDNKGVYMNGKLTATTMTLGNVFNPPGFGVCKINPLFPKPCAPAVTQWMGFYDGLTINGSSNPLTDSSQGTCASGCPNCITFQMTGQIPIPGLPQMKQAAAAHQNDINPMGCPEALDEVENNKKVATITDVYWMDNNGNKQHKLKTNESVTLYIETADYTVGEVISFSFKDNDDVFHPIQRSGIIGTNGLVVLEDFRLENK